MTCHIIDVLAGESKWTFQNPAHFCKWLREGEENPVKIYIWGVPVRGGQGSTEVAQFLAKQLRLPKPLYRWQKRKLVYLKKQCGHRSGEEWVVCKPQSRKLHDDHQPLALTADSSAVMPLALAAESRAVIPTDESAILFSETTILNGESAILCEKTGRLTSRKSIDPVASSVTSSTRGYKRRFTPEPGSMRELLLQNPDLPDLQHSQKQQPSGTTQVSPVEKEAIRWKGKYWIAHSPVRPPRSLW